MVSVAGRSHEEFVSLAGQDVGKTVHGVTLTWTLLDQVARTISHHSFDVRFREFANRMLLFAPLPLIVHIVAFALFAKQPYYPLAMVLTTPAASSAYARAQRWVDLVAGAAFVYFAVDFALG